MMDSKISLVGGGGLYTMYVNVIPRNMLVILWLRRVSSFKDFEQRWKKAPCFYFCSGVSY
jgi:hypothetical protein